MMISTKQNTSQGLQSCLEPLVLEPCVLLHNLVLSKPDQTENPCSEIEKSCKSDKNRWNFIEALTSTSHNNSKPVYIPPLLKHSSSSMSTRSLRLCTESLMSESGSNTFLSIDEFSCLISEKKNSSTIKLQSKSSLFSKKVKHNNFFPPPLTSISGGEGVQMLAHREGGRLVIKAFALSSCRSCFNIERANGRLRLSLFKNDDRDNKEEVEARSGYEADFHGGLRREKVGCKIREGEWCNSRCNGDGRLPSLPICVAIS